MLGGCLLHGGEQQFTSFCLLNFVCSFLPSMHLYLNRVSV